MEMKYITTQTEGQGVQMFIFPKNIDHDRFAEVLSYVRTGSSHNWERSYREPISAGFTDGKTCYGKSETLELSSDPRDTELLQKGGHLNAPRVEIKKSKTAR